MDAAHELVHATAIALDGRAALIRGPSGSGKSDLALRCLALGPALNWTRPARLISDDQVSLTRTGDILIAAPPPTIEGQLEVRGIGIISVPFEPQARVELVVDLVDSGQVERMPGEKDAICLLGVSLPLMRLAPFEASAAIKLVTRLSLCRP